MKDKIISELHLRKIDTPDSMVESYYRDAFEVAQKKGFKVDVKMKPLFENEFNYDEGDKIIFCMMDNHTKIFDKPLQICIGNYLQKKLSDEFIKVEEILFFKEHFSNLEDFVLRPETIIEIKNPGRILKAGDEVSLAKFGLLVKAVINNKMMHLIWEKQLHSKIINNFFLEGKSKKNFSFQKWFNQKYPKALKLKIKPLMEEYCKTLSKQLNTIHR